MKNVKFLLSAACALFAVAAMAQQDFSDPKYAVWGDTPQEREQNILNSNFLKESLDNKDYNAAAHYLKELLDKCPKASQNTFVRGITLYKNKIARAKSIAEKNTYTDSLMIVYDLRNEYFGDHPKYGTPYILDRKAREYLMYKPADRKGIREAFRAAIEAGGDNTDPETVVAYFSNLCDDYRNTDEVMPDEIIAEYDLLTPFFEKNPAAAEYKSQFDAAFGLSGAASCENLERLFKGKLAAAPDDEALLSQAVALMSRAKCDGDFYFSIAEKYYQVKPSSETAMFLAQAFQNKKDYAKAKTYLNEALDVEKDPAERQKLLVRIALVGLVSNDIPALPPLRARPATWIPRTAFRTSSWRSAMLRRQVRAAVSPVWRPIGPLTIRWPRRSNCSRPIRSTWSTPRVPSASSVRFSPARRSASSTSCRRVRAIR